MANHNLYHLVIYLGELTMSEKAKSKKLPSGGHASLTTATEDYSLAACRLIPVTIGSL